MVHCHKLQHHAERKKKRTKKWFGIFKVNFTVRACISFMTTLSYSLTKTRVLYGSAQFSAKHFAVCAQCTHWDHAGINRPCRYKTRANATGDIGLGLTVESHYLQEFLDSIFIFRLLPFQNIFSFYVCSQYFLITTAWTILQDLLYILKACLNKCHFTLHSWSNQRLFL